MGEITGITDLIALTRNKLMLPYTLLQISAKQRRGDKHVKNAVTVLKEVVSLLDRVDQDVKTIKKHL